MNGSISPDSTVFVDGVEVARAGTWPGMNGQVTLSRQDLERAVANYDSEHEECTTVIDHDKSGPSLGTWESFKMDGDRMVGRLKTTFTTAQKMLKGGEYPRRSIWLSPNVPEKQGYYPRHISLLGAKPPAIPGMAPVQAHQMVMLATSDDGDICLYLTSEDDTKEAVMADNTQAQPDAQLAADVATLQTQVEALLAANAEKEAQLTAQEQILATLPGRDAEFATMQRELRISKAAKLIDEKDTGRNMTGPMKEQLTAMLAAALNQDSDVLLASGDKVSPADALLSFIDTLPKDFLPNTNASGKPAGRTNWQADGVQFSAGTQANLDQAREKYGADSPTYKRILLAAENATKRTARWAQEAS